VPSALRWRGPAAPGMAGWGDGAGGADDATRLIIAIELYSVYAI